METNPTALEDKKLILSTEKVKDIERVYKFDNDPSAGSPTETLLRLLLPLNAQVWESFQTATKVKLRKVRSKYLTKTFNR